MMSQSANHNANVVVRNIAPKGRGVFSKKTFRSGDLVITGKPIEGPTARSWATIQMDVDVHIIPDEPFLVANHSCEPNCGLQHNEYGAYDLVALRDIARGEEITWDYCMCEWEMVGFSECHCGSSTCRKTICGAKNLPETFFEKHSGFLAPYYEKMTGAK